MLYRGPFSGFDAERFLLEDGRKPVIKREKVPVDDAVGLAAGFQQRGYAVVRSERLTYARGRADGHDHTGSELTTLFVSGDEALARRAMALSEREVAGGSDRAEVIAELGGLLGYPACCVAAFVERASAAALGGGGAGLHLSALQNTSGVLDPRLNTIGAPLALISHVPCALNCEPSGALAARVEAGLTAFDPEIASANAALRRRPVIWWSPDCAVAFDGTWDGDAFVFERFSPLARDPGTRRPERWSAVADLLSDADRWRWRPGELGIDTSAGPVAVQDLVPLELPWLFDWSGRTPYSRSSLVAPSRRLHLQLGLPLPAPEPGDEPPDPRAALRSTLGLSNDAIRAARHFDVAIAGGGPAGALCAALLRRQAPDRSVLVLEREAFPRPHVGEAALPVWAPVLARAGVLDSLDATVAIKKRGVTFTWGPPGATSEFTADFVDREAGPPAVGSWHVDRAALDRHLLEHARALGAEVRQPARLRSVERADGRWRIDGDGDEATADWLIDATGQARVVARRLGIGIETFDDLCNFAVYGYWSGSGIANVGAPLNDDERWTTIAACERGWLWHIPLSEERTSVGFVTDRETLRHLDDGGLEALYAAQIDTAPIIAALLADATLETDLTTCADWASRLSTMAGDGWLACGDAAAFVDPILSSGLVLAATGASMAANALTTLWAVPTTDRRRLWQSYERAYHGLSEAFGAMARVWYRRRFDAEEWQAEAKRRRLTLYETDRDAFTALCLGAVGSPLDVALPAPPRDAWQTEFYSWLTARNLFPNGAPDAWSRVHDVTSGRRAAREEVRRRWRKLVHARVTIRAGVTWEAVDGYHTSRLTDRWHPVRAVEVDVDGWRVAFPTFDDLREGVIGSLDVARPAGDVIRDLLWRHPIGGERRERRLEACAKTLLQLEMMGALTIEEATTPRLSGHPLLTALLPAICRSVDHADLAADIEWLGDAITLHVDTTARRTYRLFDARHATTEHIRARGTTTAIRHLGPHDDATATRFATHLAARLSRAARDLWDRIREHAGRSLQVRVRPDEAPRLIGAQQDS